MYCTAGVTELKATFNCVLLHSVSLLTKVARAVTVGLTVIVYVFGTPGQTAFPVVDALAEIVNDTGWLVLLVNPVNAGMIELFPEVGSTAPSPLGNGF